MPMNEHEKPDGENGTTASASPAPTPRRQYRSHEEFESALMETAQRHYADTAMRAQSDMTRSRPINTGDPNDPTFLEQVGHVATQTAKGALNIVTHPKESARSAVRGVGRAVDAAAETTVELGAWLVKHTPLSNLVDDEWHFVYDQLGTRGIAQAGTETIDRTNDAIFGPRSEQPSMQFVEDLSTFVTGFVAAGKLKLFKGGPALAELGVVGAAARGAIVDFGAFDPYEAQLAELAARANVAGIREVGQLLSVTENDGPIAARLKRAAGGLIPGVALDALVASARLFRSKHILSSSTASAAERQGAAHIMAESQRTLDAIAEGTHVSNDPVVVRPTADGQFVLALNDRSIIPAKRPGEVAEVIPGTRGIEVRGPRATPERPNVESILRRPEEEALRNQIETERAAAVKEMFGPKYGNRWQAEAQAASINEALAVRFDAATPLSGAKMQEVLNLVKEIEHNGNTPSAAVKAVSESRFNFTYMDPPEKVESLLRAIGDKLSPVFDRAQGRPVVSAEESIDRALQLAGMVTRDDAADYFRNVGSVLKNTDANVLALNARLIELGDQVAKWSTILDQRSLDVVAQVEARRALRAYIRFAADVAGSNSGVGRGLNALKFRGDPRLKGGLKFKGEPGAAGIPAVEGFAPDIVADMTATQLRDVSRLFRLTKQPKVLFNTLASELRPQAMGKAASFGRGLLEYFYNSVLSNPATHAAIFLANGTVSALEDGVRFLAGAVRRDPEMLREATDLLVGRMTYLKQSVKGMGMAFLAGHSIIDPRPVYKAIPGVGGEIIRTFGTRPIAAMDEFWRVSNNLAYVRMRSASVARREAAAQGLAGKDLDQFIAQRVDADVRASLDPSGASRLPEAREFASLPTFSSPLKEGSFGRDLEKFVQNHPVLTPVLPFVRTSVNVFDYSFNKMSPLGLLSRDIREAMSAGGPEGAVMATRMAVGSTIWGMAGLLAFSGDITGRGPTDPRLRKMWLASHQPYSVRVGDKWISYRRAEPFATPLSLAADVAHILRDNADDINSAHEGSKVFYALVAATAQAVTNKTYLSGLVQFMDAIGSGQPGEVKGFVDGLTQVAVPSFTQLFNDDPYFRETRNVFDAMAARVPGWSNNLPAKYNVFGEPILKTPGNVQRALNPLPIRDAQPGLEEEFLQLQRAFVAPPTFRRYGDVSVNLHDRKYANKNGGDLTPYERLMQSVAEQNLRGQIERLVESKAFQRAGAGTDVFAGGRRYKELQDMIERVYVHAERRMLAEYPELRSDLKLLQRAVRASGRSDVKAESILDRLPR